MCVQIIGEIIEYMVTLIHFGLHTDIMVNMGYARKEIEESLGQNKYDDITATYLLLGRRTTEVSPKVGITQGSVLLPNLDVLCVLAWIAMPGFSTAFHAMLSNACARSKYGLPTKQRKVVQN